MSYFQYLEKQLQQAVADGRRYNLISKLKTNIKLLENKNSSYSKGKLKAYKEILNLVKSGIV